LPITDTAQSHKPFFISKLQNPNPVLTRFLLRKPETGSCRTESGSKKCKIQSMDTPGRLRRQKGGLHKRAALRLAIFFSPA